MKQEFHMVLALDEFTDEVADALFDAGFDDAHLIRSEGRPCIVIDNRDTSNLRETVRAAVDDCAAAGVKVLRVQIPDVDQINAELASAS